jgi:hypothetical protein
VVELFWVLFIFRWQPRVSGKTKAITLASNSSKKSLKMADE